MGLLDIFKKNKKNDNVSPNTPEKKDFEFTIVHDHKGSVEYEYTDLSNASFKKFYDTTRLVVKKEQTILPNGEPIYEGAISWYNEDDAEPVNDSYVRT